MEPKRGDIILYPAGGKSAWSSRLVAAGEILVGLGKGLKQYSHAAILDVDGFQYEATFPKTGRFPIDIARPYEVWNVGNPTDEQRERIIRWCQVHVGKWYNLTGVLTCNLVRLPGSYYCSQFAGYAYRAAHEKIGDAIMSPDSIPDYPGAVLVQTYMPK